MNCLIKIVFIACLFAINQIDLFAQAGKMFVTTANGDFVYLSVNEEKVFLAVNNLPVALNVKVDGFPVIGVQNKVTYTYKDDLKRVEKVSILNWYVADNSAGANKIKVFTGLTYTPELIYEGKFLCVGVLPVADDGAGGTVNGDEVFTSWKKLRGSFYTNPFVGDGILHMNINVVNVDFGAGHLAEGDEIAVFDGTICCAHATVSKPVSLSDPTSFIALSASQVDFGNDGYTPGNAISIRVWSKANAGSGDYAASLVFIDPNSGDPVSSPVFESAITAFVKLSITP